jgi:hypothetical protein
MEISVNYSKQFEDEESYISMKTPLIPVKYQLRTFKDKQLGYNRAIMYFQWAGTWRVRLHMDVEELLAMRRKIDAFIRKKVKDGHIELETIQDLLNEKKKESI